MLLFSNLIPSSADSNSTFLYVGKNTISKSEEIYEKKIQEYEKQVEDLFRKKLFKEALELSVYILQQLDRERVEDDVIVKF